MVGAGSCADIDSVFLSDYTFLAMLIFNKAIIYYQSNSNDGLTLWPVAQSVFRYFYIFFIFLWLLKLNGRDFWAIEISLTNAQIL